MCVCMERAFSKMENKCVLPFIGHDYHKDSPCCLLQNKDGTKWDSKISDINDLIDDHKKDKKSIYCDQCWKDEDVGVTSRRQRYNQLYKAHLHLTERQVKALVIPTGNVCNLYCVTCSPNYSTSWIKKQMSFKQGSQFDDDEIITEINPSDVQKIHEAEHIEFIGGETLKSFSLWRHLSTLDKATSFSLQTNGTIELNQGQVELLQSFNNFNICFSLDGYGKIFDYLRQPAKWHQVEKNVKQYKEYFGKDRLSILFTVSNLNIFYIDNIMYELFKLLPSTIDLNMVEAPSEMAYNNLPRHVGERVEKHNPGFFKNRNVDWSGTDESMEKLKMNLREQDNFSGLKKEKHLPELFELI